MFTDYSPHQIARTLAGNLVFAIILTIDIVLEDFLGVLIGIAMIPFAAAAVVIIFILGVADVVSESFQKDS